VLLGSLAVRFTVTFEMNVAGAGSAEVTGFVVSKTI
jgi:hypothetical protein